MNRETVSKNGRRRIFSARERSTLNAIGNCERAFLFVLLHIPRSARRLLARV